MHMYIYVCIDVYTWDSYIYMYIHICLYVYIGSSKISKIGKSELP